MFPRIVFGQESKTLEIIAPSPKEVNSNEFFAAPFVIINHSSKPHTINLKVTLPENWSLISTIVPISLGPAEQKRVFMNIYVPPTAISEIKYRIALGVTSLDGTVDVSASFNMEVVPQISVEVSVLKQDRKKTALLGEITTGKFSVRNTGNKKETFKMRVESTHYWPVSLKQTSIVLKPSESKSIVVTIPVPKEITREVNQNLKLIVISSSDKNIFDSEYVTIHLDPIRVGKSYETARVKIKSFLSAIGTGTPLAPQAEVDITGEFYEGYNLDYNWRGPFFKDRINHKTVSSEQFLVRLRPKGLKKNKEDSWYAEGGDITTQFSDLLLASRTGRGNNLHYTQGILTSNLTYNTSKIQSGFFDYFFGGDVGVDIMPKVHSKVTYIKNTSDWTITDESPTVNNKTLASILTIFKPFKPLTITYEYGISNLSKTTATDNTEYDKSAHQLIVNFSKNKFKQKFEYVYADSFFAGAKSNIETYHSYMTYSPLSWASGYLSLRRDQDNTDRDVTKPINTSYQGELGSNMILKSIGILNLSFHYDQSKDRGQNSAQDRKVRYVRSRISRKFGPWFTFSMGVRKGKDKDHFNAVFKEISDYDERLNFTKGRFQSWVSYDRKKQKTIGNAGLEKNIYKTAGMSYAFSKPNITINGEYTQNRTKATSSRKKNSLLVKINYRPNKDLDVKFELEKKDGNIGQTINKHIAGRWRGYLTITYRFGVPIPWRKVGASLKGMTFVDKNANAIFDEGDTALAKVGLTLKKYKTKSNSSGRFHLKGLKPGKYKIYLDSTTYDISLAPLIELPLEVHLLKGKVSEVHIPFSATAKMIKGIVFSDPERTGEYSKDKNGLVSMRLDFINEKGEIFRSTTTDSSGKYRFANMPVGRYQLRVNSDWLKKGYKVVNNQEYEIELKEGESISDFNFGIAEKQRPIKKTFIQTIDREEIKKEEF